MKLNNANIQLYVDKVNRGGFQGNRINQATPKPNIFPNTGTKIYRAGKPKQRGGKLNPMRVAEGEFLGKAVDMRGKRQYDKFRDKEIEFYDPIRMFQENKAGQFTRDSGAGLGGRFTTKPSGKYEDQLGKITVLDPKPKKGIVTGGQVEYAPIKNQAIKLSQRKQKKFEKIVN